MIRLHITHRLGLNDDLAVECLKSRVTPADRQDLIRRVGEEVARICGREPRRKRARICAGRE